MRAEVPAGATEEESVAIVVAVEALWPKPIILSPSEQAARATAWRFSGRWWTTPLPARRARPFR